MRKVTRPFVYRERWGKRASWCVRVPLGWRWPRFEWFDNWEDAHRRALLRATLGPSLGLLRRRDVALVAGGRR